MAKLRDSLSKLREHLDNLQKRKGFPYDSDNENDIITDNNTRSNGNRNFETNHPTNMTTTANTRVAQELQQDSDGNYPPGNYEGNYPDGNSGYHSGGSYSNKPSRENNNNVDPSDPVDNGMVDDDTGDTSMNESDAASTGTSQRGTNDR